MNLDFIIEMAWKSAAISGVALVVLMFLRSRSAVDRAAVLRLAVLLLLLLPLLSIVLPALEVEEPAPEAIGMPIAATEVTEAGTVPARERVVAASAAAEPTFRTSPPPAEPLLPSLSSELLLKLAYVAGLLLIIGRLLAGLWTLQRWTERGEEVASPLWIGAFRRACAASGATPRLRLLMSGAVPSPLSWGFRAPVILIDPATLDRPEDADAILAHEIAHVVRRDWPMLMASRLAAALFWFNPLVWLLERALVQQAEEAADLHAVKRVEPTTYAQTLVSCFRHAAGAVVPANSIAAGHGLARRVGAILDARRRGTPSGSPWTATAMVACVAIAAPLAALELVPPSPPSPPAPPVAPLAPKAPSAPVAPRAPQAPAAPAAPPASVAPVPPQAPEAPQPPAAPVQPQLAQLDATIAAAAASAAAGSAAAAEAATSAGLIDPDMLVKMKIHGVSADYLAELAAIGPRFAKMDPDELITFRIHGLTPTRLRQFAELGNGSADQDDLVAMAIHGVSPAFIRDMAAAGYRGLPADKLVAMRIHGVNPDRVRRANAAARRLSPDDLVEMAIHGRL